MQIAESDQLEEGVRCLAAEFLVTLCEAREKAPGMMRKLPQVCLLLGRVCLGPVPLCGVDCSLRLGLIAALLYRVDGW